MRSADSSSSGRGMNDSSRTLPGRAPAHSSGSLPSATTAAPGGSSSAVIIISSTFGVSGVKVAATLPSPATNSRKPSGWPGASTVSSPNSAR